jgi:hypothetical protein
MAKISVSKISSPDIAEEVAKATKRLAEERSNVSAQAERLNVCIERFEAWIGGLRGRVQADIRLPIPDANTNDDDPREFELIVRVAREGKVWRVMVGTWEIGDDAPIDWSPLRESGLDTKLHVIPKLPLLIVEMAAKQEELKQRIDNVATAFEEFAAQIDMPKGGE